MAQPLMTKQAKTKVQELAKYPKFRNSLEKFVKASEIYTSVKQPIPKYNLFKRPIYRNIIKNINHNEDVYVFRDKSNRFIFTIEKDEKENKVAVLVDVLDINDVTPRLYSTDKQKYDF